MGCPNAQPTRRVRIYDTRRANPLRWWLLTQKFSKGKTAVEDECARGVYVC